MSGPFEAIRRIIEDRPPGAWYRIWRILADWPEGAQRREALGWVDDHAPRGSWSHFSVTPSLEARLFRCQSLLDLLASEPAERRSRWLPDLLAATLFFEPFTRYSEDRTRRSATMQARLGDALRDLGGEAVHREAIGRVRSRESMHSEDYDGMSAPLTDDAYMGPFVAAPELDRDAFCRAALLWTREAAVACTPSEKLAFSTLCGALVERGADEVTLRLTAPDLPELPPGLGAHSDLTSLYINIQGLERLPADFSALVALRTLCLENMFALRALPDTFGDLASLQTLKLLACGFPGIPEVVCTLPALRELVYHGSIHARETIPTARLGRLKALRELHIVSGSMTTLPPEIGQMTALRTLVVHGARIETLPEEVGELRNLERLSIIGSLALRDLPIGLERLPALRTFSAMWWGCPEPPWFLTEVQSLESVHLSCGVRMDDAALAALRAALPKAQVRVSYAAGVSSG